MVPNYVALYMTKKPIFLRGASSPAPDISLATPVFSHELATHGAPGV